MGTQSPFRDKVTVRFRKRDDGGLVATCEQVNGFYLSGANPRAVIDDVIPVLDALFSHNMGITNVAISMVVENDLGTITVTYPIGSPQHQQLRTILPSEFQTIAENDGTKEEHEDGENQI